MKLVDAVQVESSKLFSCRRTTVGIFARVAVLAVETGSRKSKGQKRNNEITLCRTSRREGILTVGGWAAPAWVRPKLGAWPQVAGPSKTMVGCAPNQSSGGRTVTGPRMKWPGEG